jgi:hypothetical protein
MDALHDYSGEAAVRVAEVPGLTRARRLLLQGARAQSGSLALGRLDALWSRRLECQQQGRMILHQSYLTEFEEARRLLNSLFPFVRELFPFSNPSSYSSGSGTSVTGGGIGTPMPAPANAALFLPAGDSSAGGASSSELYSFAWAFTQV